MHLFGDLVTSISICDVNYSKNSLKQVANAIEIPTFENYSYENNLRITKNS